MVHSSYKDDDFKSILSPYILRFLETKETAGSDAKCYLSTLRDFDRFFSRENYHLFVLSNQTLRYGGED